MARRSRLQSLSRPPRDAPASGNALLGGARVRKFRNIPTIVDGQRFDSKKEARRFVELSLLQRAGAISDLKRGERYQFYHNDVKIGSYKPDFEYTENGEKIVEDVKSTSTKTQAYMLRKKMMKAFYGIEIRET